MKKFNPGDPIWVGIVDEDEVYALQYLAEVDGHVIACSYRRDCSLSDAIVDLARESNDDEVDGLYVFSKTQCFDNKSDAMDWLESNYDS